MRGTESRGAQLPNDVTDNAPILVEACVDSVASAIAAERGGARRLELCDALFDGGTTPSAGMIAACKEAVSIPVVVMIRPRGGGFVYSDAERDVMRRDVVVARDLGADGAVIGGLRPDGTVDCALVSSLLEAAPELPVTFHRAFDLTPDLGASLESLIDCGVERVLTAGGAPTAAEGATTLAKLVRQAGSRLNVMAGGGVREENVRTLVSVSGVREVHVRLTRLTRGPNREASRDVRVRRPLPEDEAAWEETDEQRVRSFVRTLAAIATLLVICGVASQAMAQASGTQNGSPRVLRPAPPARDPRTPGFVAATELSDGTVPSPGVDGNFIIGPTHAPASEMVVRSDIPHGAVYTFTMRSSDSRIYPGIARDSGTFGVPDPSDPAKLIVTTSHPAPYTRRVAVYVPAQYVRGSVAPFIVGADGPDSLLFVALDNLIAAKRVPVMIAISIGNGGGDAQGSERGLEYDTMSGRYAEFVETEVLPLVERQYGVTLTKDPNERATMGFSSGGAAALSMAWYRTDLYHRVLAYSLTAVNQQWPPNPESPHGAWEYHEHLIPNSPVKPIRIWMMVGDKDLLNPNPMRDEMHDWVVANERLAAVFAAKGYHYQFVFARNALHVDHAVRQQTLPEALEWLWRG